MSQAVITKVFSQWKAQQAINNQPVTLDEFIFAYIPGLDVDKPIENTETTPAVDKIVYRQAVNKAGVVNENSVVYSVTLGADVGDFDFNWIGLANKATGTLAMIIHAPTQRKIKTATGQQGNVLVRSMLMEFNGAKEATGIITPAETWQIDFTARLTAMDERQRRENIDLYGAAAFFDSGYLVAKSGNQFFVTKGAGYVAGLRSELPADLNITASAKPTKVWLDVCWTGTLTSEWTVQSKITVATDLADYVHGGVQHYVFAVAHIDVNGLITDLRPKGTLDEQQNEGALKQHEKSRNHPDGTTSEKGFVRLSSATDSDSEQFAATPRAVKKTMENANSRLSIAENGADIIDPDEFVKNLRLSSSSGANKIGNGDTTVGEILKQKVYIIAGSGQSNYAGANSGGPNPASEKVKVWDGVTNEWGSSDFTKKPFSRSNPHGNNGNNNIALAFAHRLVDEFKAEKVYIIHDAQGGRPIENWISDGFNSERYAAIKNKVEAAFATPEIIESGKTEIDFFIFAQGEANGLTDTVSDYRTKFGVLDKQLRSESWMNDITPLFIMGMSGLHTRYQVWLAQLDYCENVNRNCIYVNSAGLKTQYDIDETGDYTHWLGASLWEHGYYRIWQALHERGATHRQYLPAFYGRGGGPWNGQADAIAAFSSVVSRDSITSEFPVNGPAARGSITWGYKCNADGNYTLAGGYEVTTDNFANYSAGWGRELVFNSLANYSAAFGYQHVLNQWGQFAAGRGHNLQHHYETALGRYSKYVTEQENPVLIQLGCGQTDERRNAITVRSDGATEIFTGTRHNPAQKKEIVFEYISDTQLKLKMRGTDGVIRSVTMQLS